MTPELQYIPYKTPYYESGAHMVALFQEPSLNSKIISSLEVKAKAGQLSCDKEEVFTIKYAVVGEKAGAVDLMYLVRGSCRVRPSTSVVGMFVASPLLLRRSYPEDTSSAGGANALK